MTKSVWQRQGKKSTQRKREVDPGKDRQTQGKRGADTGKARTNTGKERERNWVGERETGKRQMMEKREHEKRETDAGKERRIRGKSN